MLASHFISNEVQDGTEVRGFLPVGPLFPALRGLLLLTFGWFED